MSLEIKQFHPRPYASHRKNERPNLFHREFIQGIKANKIPSKRKNERLLASLRQINKKSNKEASKDPLVLLQIINTHREIADQGNTGNNILRKSLDKAKTKKAFQEQVSSYEKKLDNLEREISVYIESGSQDNKLLEKLSTEFNKIRNSALRFQVNLGKINYWQNQPPLQDPDCQSYINELENLNRLIEGEHLDDTLNFLDQAFELKEVFLSLRSTEQKEMSSNKEKQVAQLYEDIQAARRAYLELQDSSELSDPKKQKEILKSMRYILHYIENEFFTHAIKIFNTRGQNFTDQDEIKKMKSDSNRVKNQAFDAHSRFAVWLSRKYHHAYHSSNSYASIEDTIQMGLMGLYQGINKFYKQFELTTYSDFSIKQEITRGIEDYKQFVNVSVTRKNHIKKVKEAQRKLEENGTLRDRSMVEQLAKETSLPVVDVERALFWSDKWDHIASIDDQVNDGEYAYREDNHDEENPGINRSLPLANNLIDKSKEEKENQVHENAINNLLKRRISRVLRTLSFREREIIKLRYGLDGNKTHTLEEVGFIFKVGKERIRQIEAKAIGKLQKPSRSQELVEFFN